MKSPVSLRSFTFLGSAVGAVFVASFAGCAAGPIESETGEDEAVLGDVGPLDPAGAETPQPPPGEVCVEIKRGGQGNVADAFLAGDYAGYANGSELNMYSGVSTGGNVNRVVVGFDLSPLPEASHITITSATFSIYKSWSADNATVSVYRATAPWSEATVTRESFGDAIDPVAVGSFSGSGTGMKTVDLKALVQAWGSGQAPNDGIVLDEFPTVSHHYFSSEAGPAYAPSLTVCYVGATCADGIENQGETGLDCGGPCAACPTCNDGVKNQSETGVDCGGPCAACASCNDGVKNQGETGIDCGGPCAACPTCSDGIKNQGESGADCGGPCALPCSSSQVGSFNINQGPSWSGNPQSYTCTEACAQIFGGTSGQYGCSTVNGTLNNLAWADGWGDSGHCPGGTPVADTYEKPAGGNYNCGSNGCSYSAYVADHGCTGPNYCWKTLPAATSCKTLLASAPGTPSGVYTLDADGAGPIAPFQAYCDMTNDGGGWTLALRAQSSASVYRDFYSSYWTDGNLLNAAANIDPSTNTDAKYASFTSIPGTEIRGCLRNPATGVFGCKYYTYGASKTLRSLFADTPVGSQNTGKGLFLSEASPATWLTMWGQSMNNASTGACYLRVGVNIDDDVSCYHARVRFGFALNNECDISTLNDTAGFGASAYASSTCDGQESAWRVGAGFAAGANLYGTIGAMYVR